jgi:hypothetical protein
MSDYVPSKHRGPGCMDGEEAKTIRQQASQHETVAKKCKVALVAASSKGGIDALEPFGAGVKLGVYMGDRHKSSKKGKDFPEFNHLYLASKYGTNFLVRFEAPAREMVPKYSPVDDSTQWGSNLSPGLDPGEAMIMALQHKLRDSVPKANGMRMSMAAVNLRQVVKAELLASYATAPTEDEIKAAMALAIVHSEENAEFATPAERIAVSKYH